jgi:hypothetical protein
VTRVVRTCLQRLLEGRALSRMYVDDIIGIAPKDVVYQVITDSVAFLETLLGPGCVAADKTEVGRRLVALGWDWDLDTGTVAPSERCVDRALTLYDRMRVTGAHFSVKEYQAAASLASRYSMIAHELRPFTHVFYRHVANRDGTRFRSGGVRLPTTKELSDCATLWCSQLLLMELGCRHRRPIATLVRRPTTVLLESDASLTGLGVRLFDVDPHGVETLRTVLSVTLPFDIRGRPEFQNTMELLGIVLGMAVAVTLGVRDTGVHLRGDSRTALSWATREAFRGGASSSTAMAYLHLCREWCLYVDEDMGSTHVAGVTLVECDTLSRAEAPGVYELLGYAPELVAASHPAVQQLVAACNPLTSPAGSVEWASHVTHVLALVRSL